MPTSICEELSRQRAEQNFADLHRPVLQVSRLAILPIDQ